MSGIAESWRAIVLDLVALALCFLAVGIAAGVALVAQGQTGHISGVLLLIGFTASAVLGLIAIIAMNTNRMIQETKTTIDVAHGELQEVHRIINSELASFKKAIADTAREEIARAAAAARAAGVTER